MSLIPSESYSFPEPLGTDVRPARRLKGRDRPSSPPPKRENLRAPRNVEPKKLAPNNRVSKVTSGNGSVRRLTPSKPATLPQPVVVRRKSNGASWIDSSGELNQISRRRRIKLVRFIIFESVALVALLFSAKLGMSHPFPGDPLRPWFIILTILAAVTVGGIPIIFYGLPPSLPHDRR
jgi:hypothetical protein